MTRLPPAVNPAAAPPATPVTPPPLMTPRRRRQRWLLPAIGAGLVLAFAAIAWVQQRQVALLSDAVRYEGDNLTWSFFQLEMESVLLRDALRQAVRQPGPVDLDGLRLRHELFASRLPLVSLDRTERFAKIGYDHARLLAAAEAYLHRHDAVLAESATTAPTPARLQAALADLEPLIEPLHDLSLKANQVIAEQIGQRNDAVREQTRLGIGLTVFQSLLTLAFAAVTLRQFRILRGRRADLKRLAAHLMAARSEAESASHAKSAFLANMSHELRTPFNGMLGMLSLLKSTRLDATQADLVRTARESARHLMALLDDILDVSRLDSGRLDIHPEPTDLHGLIAEVQLQMAPAAQVKGLALQVDVQPDVPGAVLADGKRLKQILFNLLVNAVKFTGQGSVALRVTADAAAPASAASPAPDAAAPLPGATQRRQLRFEVIDTGPGIPDDLQPRLFQRFVQGDDSTTRRHGGSGLGLEISRSLARLMGGDITLTSPPGGGASFTFSLSLPELTTLPTQAPPLAGDPADALPTLSGSAWADDALAASADAAAAQATSRPLDLLVADDHPVNRKYMALLLQRLGHRVRLADDGAQAVAEVQRQPPDLVLMDLHMPVQDGFAATRALRALPAPTGQVPIAAISADAFDATRERALAAGMNKFLRKPVQADDIEALLVDLFGTRARPRDSADSADSRPDNPAAMTLTTAAPPDVRPARRRFRSSDVAQNLDMAVIGDVCVGISLTGYRSVLSAFLDDGAGSLAALLQALDASSRADATADRSALPGLAHAVKGAAASMGLRAVQALAQQIEQQAAQASPAEQAQMATDLRDRVATAQALCSRIGFI